MGCIFREQLCGYMGIHVWRSEDDLGFCSSSSFHFLFETCVLGTGKMAQLVKEFLYKPGVLNSIPTTQISMKGENQLQGICLWSPHVYFYTQTPTLCVNK